MSIRRFTSLLIGILLCVSPAFGSLANGRNYAPETQVVGNNFQDGNDSGVNGYMLTVPAKTSSQPPKAWGLFYAIEQVADSTGTNDYGMALYGPSGTLLCSVYGARTVVEGVNSYDLSGCPAPVANTSYTLAYLTTNSGGEPGNNAQSDLTSFACPGTASFSGYVAESSFPATLPATSAQTFCYSFYATEILAAGVNGKFYGGNAGVTSQISGIPTGPWTQSGSWYGGLNTASTFVSFSGGLSAGVYPTTTALANSTYGTACSAWDLGSANQVIAGAAAGHLNLLTPVSASGVGYGGNGTLTFQYTTGANRNYVACVFPSTYPALALGFHIKTDVPNNDTLNNQYDSGRVDSTSGTDSFAYQIMGGGAQLFIETSCEFGAGSVHAAQDVPIKSGTNYWIWLVKRTNGAMQTLYVFDQDTGGSYVGQTNCAADTGTNDAASFTTTINGAEPNSTGYHVWEDDFEVNTTGAFLAP